LAHSTVKFEDVPVNDEIEPVIDFESPIYVKRYVPAAVPSSIVQEVLTVLVPRIVLVLDQLYIVDGCESVRTVDHCPEISWSTVRKVPSSLKLFLGFAPTNWAVTVSPALYGLLPTSIRTWPKSFPKGVLSTITCVCKDIAFDVCSAGAASDTGVPVALSAR